MLLNRIILIQVLIVLGLKVLSQEKSLVQCIDSVVTVAIQNEAFPGCVIYFSKGDKLIFHKAYGFHTYDSTRTVKKSTLYDLASLTKVMGGTLALMKLYEDGYFDLEDKIGDHINGLGRKVGSATFREVLAHQAGLYPWIPFYKKVKRKNGSYKKKTISFEQSREYPISLTDSLFLHKDFYSRLKKFIRKSDVSEKSYTYSGLFFYLIPELVEKYSGQNFETFLKNQFYEPLHSHSLTFNPLGEFDLSHIAPTEVDDYFRMELLHGKVHDEGAIFMNGVSGNAGLFGNAEDVAKLWKLFLDDGKIDSTFLLDPNTIDLFSTAQYPNNDNRRGLGFDKPLLQYDPVKSSVARDASFKSFGHSGYTGTLAWADPQEKLLFVFLSNRVYPSRKNTNIYNMNIRPTIHQIFYDFVNEYN